MAEHLLLHSIHRFIRVAALIALAALASGPIVGSRAQTGTAGQKPAATPDKPMTGKELADTVCTSCHGPTGNSTDPKYPKIAGQKATYLRAELRAFRHGTRKSDVMKPLAGVLSDAQITELARFYSGQSVKPETVKDRTLADLGARIYRYRGRGVPACAACHSPGGYGPGMMGGRGGMMGGGMMRGGMMHGMMGNTELVPRLFGQHAEYTVAQLDAFASGKRRATVMGPIAARLSSHERQAVAAYLAGRR